MNLSNICLRVTTYKTPTYAKLFIYELKWKVSDVDENEIDEKLPYINEFEQFFTLYSIHHNITRKSECNIGDKLCDVTNDI